MEAASSTLPKRHLISTPSKPKRPCFSPSPSKTTIPPIQTLLTLPESAIWSLRKADLRAYFLALQSYALNPNHLTPSLVSIPCSRVPVEPAELPLLLRLPLEIRQQIYIHCLSPPANEPIPGPHPRQLQSPLHLTLRFPPALLLLNQQIRSEALPILYGASEQVVHVKVDYNIWLHKTRRSELILSPQLTNCVRHIHLLISLGSEKRGKKLKGEDADARVEEVRKGIRKLGKWLSGARVATLKVDWQEPASTYSWETKRSVLDGLRALEAEKVEIGEVNWGLTWNRGRKFRFEEGYMARLERGGGQ